MDLTPFYLPKYDFGTREWALFWAEKYKRHAWKLLGTSYFPIYLIAITNDSHFVAGVVPLYGSNVGFIYFSRRGHPGTMAESEIWTRSGVPNLLAAGRDVGGVNVPELALADRGLEGS